MPSVSDRKRGRLGVDGLMEGKTEAGMDKTLTKAMHINDVTPCVEIDRFDAQLFHTKFLPRCGTLTLFTQRSRPGSRQVPLLKQTLAAPSAPTSYPSSLFFCIPVNFKTCPEKRPNCPVSLKCLTKSDSSSARPQGALMFSRCLDLPMCDSSSRF